MNRPILYLDGITVSYDGMLVLDAPSFEVQEGETLAVIGPNGAGKSTLLRVLGLLERPTEGQVVFGGRPILQDGNLLMDRRRMASVFQEPLLTDGTVEANVALGLRLRRIDSAEVSRRVQEGMTTLGIGHLAKRRTRTLSGGEAQRVSLARALVLDPEVFLLDEPFAALDPPTREALLLDLKTILDKRRITTIFVTHDRNEALLLGNRVAVMMGGRVQQMDTPERVFAEPVNEEVARFVGIETILRGHVEAVSQGLATVAVPGWTLEVAVPLTPGERVLVCLRPEEITLFPRRTTVSASSARNQLYGSVIRHLPIGFTFRVTIDCGIPIVATVTRQSWEQLGLEDGSEVVAAFKATAPHVIRCL